MFLHLEIPDILRIHVYFVLVKVELTEDIVFGLSHIGFLMLIYPISVSSILASSFWISHYWFPHLEGSQDQMNDELMTISLLSVLIFRILESLLWQSMVVQDKRIATLSTTEMKLIIIWQTHLVSSSGLKMREDNEMMHFRRILGCKNFLGRRLLQK